MFSDLDLLEMLQVGGSRTNLGPTKLEIPSNWPSKNGEDDVLNLGTGWTVTNPHPHMGMSQKDLSLAHGGFKLLKKAKPLCPHVTCIRQGHGTISGHHIRLYYRCACLGYYSHSMRNIKSLESGGFLRAFPYFNHDRLDDSELEVMFRNLQMEQYSR